MSASIDERVVQMQFDNAQFEQAVAQSMKTLNNLNESLQLEDGAKGFLRLGKAAQTVSFAKIQNSLEALQNRFSIWGEISHNAVLNVVNAITGKLASAMQQLTIEPVKAGWGEYELKMGSVQTIMASTGEELSVVNKYLQELNTYSDKTIYSFSDMTASIGKFTNAGVKLEDAVAAIKGISNEAALSGANAQEASRAMYNFSQALSSGSVKLIDWKSIENANMATVGFKQQLLDTAVALKKVKKNADGTYTVLTKNAQGGTMKEVISATKGFNDSLSYQWMTADVLTATLQQYSANVEEMSDTEKEEYETKLKGMGYTAEQIKQIEQLGHDANQAATEVKTFGQMWDALKEAAGSGWATTFELIFGDYNQAKEMWTNVNNVLSGIIDGVSDARNNLLKGALGQNVWSSTFGDLTSGVKDLDKLKKVLMDIGKSRGYDIDDLVKRYGSFEKSLQAGWLSSAMFEEGLEKTGNTAKKSTTDVKGFVDVVKSVINGTYGHGDDRMKQLIDAGYDYNTIQALVNAQLKGFDITTAEFTEDQIKQIAATEDQAKALRNLKETAKDAKIPLDDVAKLTKDWEKENLSGRDLLLKGIGNLYSDVAKVAQMVKEAVNEVFEPIDAEKLYNMVKAFHDWTWEMRLGDESAEALKNGIIGILKPVKAIFKLTGQVAGAVVPFLANTLVHALTIAIGIFSAFGEVLGWVTDNFDAIKDVIVNSFITPLSDGITNTILPVWDRLKNFFETIKGYFTKAHETVEPALITLDNVKGAVVDVDERIAPITEKAKKFGDVLQKIQLAWFTEKCEKLVGIFKEIGSGAKDFLKRFFKFDGVTEKVGSAVEKLTGKFDEAVKIADIGGDASKAFETVTQGVKDFVRSCIQSIDVTGGLTMIWDNLTGLVGGLRKRITDAVGGLFDFSGAWDKVKTAVSKATGGFEDIFMLIAQGKFVDAFKRLKDNFGGFVSSLRDSFVSNESLRGILESLQSIFGSLVDIVVELVGVKLPGYLKQVKDTAKQLWDQFDGASKLQSIMTFLDGLLDHIRHGGTLEYLLDTLSALGEKLTNFFKLDGLNFDKAKPGNSVIAKVMSFIGGDDAKEAEKKVGFIQKFLDKYKPIIDKIKAFAQANMPKDIQGALGLASLLGVLRMVIKIGTFFKKLGNTVDIGSNLADMFKSVGKAADAYKKSQGSTTFKNVAIGIALLVGSLAVLTMLDVNRVKAVCMAILPLVAVIGAIIAAVMYFKTKSSGVEEAVKPLDSFAEAIDGFLKGLIPALKKMAGAIAFAVVAVGFGVALLLIAKAIITFTDMFGGGNGKKYAAGVKVVIGIALALVVVAGILSALGKGLSGVGTAFLGLAAALLIMRVVLEMYKNIDPGAALAVLVTATIMSIIVGILKRIPGNLKDASKTFMAVAKSLAVLSICMKSLAKLNQGALWSTVAALFAMAATITAVLFALSKYAGNDAGAKAAKSFSAVAKALKGMAIVVAILGFIPWDKLKLGMKAIVVPLAAITAALILLAKFGGDLEKSSKTIMSVGVAVILLSAAMAALGFVPVDKLKQGGIALVGIATGLLLMLFIVKKLDASKAAAIILAVAGALALMAVLVMVLGHMSTGKIAQGLVALLLPLIAVVAALVILCHFSNQLTALGLSMLMFGAGVLAAAAAIAVFAYALPVLLDSLEYAAVTIAGWIVKLGKAIAEGIPKVFGYIRDHLPEIIAGIGKFIKDVLNILGVILTGIPWGDVLLAAWNGLVAAAKWLGEKIVAAADWLGLNIYRMLMGAEVWLRGGISDLLGTFIDMIVDAFEDIPGIGPWLKARGEDAKKGLDEWVGNANEKLDELNKTYEEKYGKVNDTIKNENAETAATAEESLANIKQYNTETAEIMAKNAEAQGRYDLAAQIRAQAYGAKAAYEETTPEVSSAAEGFYKAASGSVNVDISGIGGEGIKTLLGSMLNTDAFNGVGDENMMAFVGGLKEGMTTDEISGLASGLGMDLDAGTIQGIQEKLPDVLSVISSMGGDSLSALRTAWDSHSPSVAFQNIGTDATLGVRNGFIAGKPLVLAAINNFGASMLNAFMKLPAQMNKSAIKAMTGYALAIRSKGGDAKKAASDVSINAANAASKYSSFYSTGRHCVQGLIDGIRSKTNEARQAARDLGNAVSAATANSVEVASPSKVFFSIGSFIVAGLVNAIVQNAYRAQRAAADMGDDTVSAVVTTMAALGRIAQEDIDYTPTITPVVDLSAAQIGFTRLNAMSDNLDLSLNGAINSKWAELEAMYERLNGMQVGTDNSDIIAAIISLKDDVAMLGESMANMKVVLNRRIVGQIDNGLGQQQLLANRGV